MSRSRRKKSLSTQQLWWGGAIIVLAILILLLGVDQNWLKSQARLGSSEQTTCQCTCRGADDNLVCADPAGAPSAECRNYSYDLFTPGGNCDVYTDENVACSPDGVTFGTVVSCNPV